MRSYGAAVLFLLLSAFFGNAQPSNSELTNETIIKLVSEGVPSATIISRIQAAEHVNFQFLPGDLMLFEQAKVPDDVFKAMAAKQNGTSIPVLSQSPAPIPTARHTAANLPATPQVQQPPSAPASVQTPVVSATPAADTRSVPIPSPPKYAVSSGGTKSVKIHGYVTAITSPTEFEIDEYRVTKDSSLTLEFEKSANAQEKTTFNADEIRVGTEMEIRGELDEASNQLTAKTVKVNLNEHQRVKRTALMETSPNLKKVGNRWEGQISVDGQHLTVNEDTAITVKPNNSQKKAAKQVEKAAKRQKQSQKPADPEVDEDEEPGVALNRIDQIRANTFISYEGTRQKDGTILAKKIEFTENELTSGEARLWKLLTPKVKASNLTDGRPGEVRIQNVGKFKLIPNADVQKYVNDLGMSLIPKYQRDLPPGDPQKIRFQFFVVNQKAPNAFALANGTVIVNSGLLTVVENEAQLAFVMGHEISHATQEHTYRQSQYHKKALMALRIGGAVAAAYGKQGIANLTVLTEAAIRNGYQRSLENQADRVGTEYLLAAGYDPREAPRVWKVMSMKLGDHRINFFWSSHDNNTTRRSYLMAELKNNYSGVDFESLKRNGGGFTEMVNSLNSRDPTKFRKIKVKY